MFQAVNVLSALNWNSEGQSCYAALSAIANNLLKISLTPQTEGK